MTTALWAVWLAVVILGPATLHACPSHGSVSHAEHHAQHHHGAANTGSKDSGHSADGRCNCVGDCCSSAVNASPLQAHVPTAQVATTFDVPAVASLPFVIESRDHAQPFANGPPAQEQLSA